MRKPYKFSKKTLDRRALYKATFEERFWNSVSKSTSQQCWNWMRSITAQGYGQIRHNGGPRTTHRVAYELTHGAIPAGLFVCHRCDNKLCCNPNHLFVGTCAENTRDAMLKGRLPTGPKNWMTGKRGESHPYHKLNNENVRDIRKRCQSGEPQWKVAQDFSITQANVSRIIMRHIWSHI